MADDRNPGDEIDEQMNMNADYRKRIADKLRNPLPMDKQFVDPPQSPNAAVASPAAAPKKKPLYPGDPIKSAIGNAFDKYLGPKNPLDE
jgi:hypothetical protein